MYNPATRRRLRRGVILITAGVVLLFGTLEISGTLDWLENRSADLRTKATLDPRRADPNILIIDIDNNSFRDITDQVGRWPWTRRVWTELLRFVSQGNPRVVLFDAVFGGAEPAADKGFANAVRAAGNVILPFSFMSAEVVSSLASEPPAQASVRATGTPSAGELLKKEWAVNVATEALASAMAGSGSALSHADSDGITRRSPLVLSYDGRQWSTLWLATAMKLTGAKDAQFRDGRFLAGPIQLPVDAKGEYIIRWHGTPQNAYKRIPLIEMVCTMHPDVCDAAVPRHPASEFTNKIVFIGASAAGSYEVRPTAVSETAPGFFIVATAIDNLLHNDAMRREPRALTVFLLVLLAAIPAYFVVVSRSILRPMLIGMATMLVYAAICFFAYRHSLWLTMASPLLVTLFSFGSNTVYKYLTVDRELSRTRGTLERYVSPQLVRYVMDNLDTFRFDGEKRKLTIFFSDVRGFTTLTEKSDPVVLLKQLNEYLEAMTDIVFRYDGIVDKFIGDGLMAHWGAFTPDRPNAMLAARASLDMMAKLHELNLGWEAAGLPTLDIGIGLNTGEVIFGNVGTGKKVDFTAIGDGVNLAARLESANKEYHTHIIVSQSTRNELGDAAEVTPLGSITVKGKTVGVEIFELTGLKAE
ncbi:MAG TPA: adenylate/guanylate cyclase domain-containing protein [Bryobacteraceae bacterium]|nr:adenylate/guanylate cyclase domain-containing protein [Bryobacteraceae bacterium]